jgi:hypothetical protein
MARYPSFLTLENFRLECGTVLSEARLAYQTYGKLASDHTHAILYPTSYGAQHCDIDWLIRANSILDPSLWFIIIPNMFGNGLSSSPSNCQDCGLREQGFWFSPVDNVRAQEQLLREVFGIEHLALIYGWSMGAQQAYHRATTETSQNLDVLETTIATGYEVCRDVEAVDEQLPLLCWQERVFVIHSKIVAKQQLQGLEMRLHHAQQKLMALTPQKGRGKRQISDLQVLLQKAREILRLHRVEGLLSFDYECQETIEETYIGRGRPTSRPKQITQKIWYQIQTVIRNEDAIAQTHKIFGWRPFVSNAPLSILSVEQAVLTYRD